MTLLSLGALTVEGYRLHTGDQTTAASAVSGALLQGERLLCEELRRELALAEYTESIRIYPDGRVYPKAWPITDPGDLATDGNRTMIGAVPNDWPTVRTIGLPPPNRSTVTYTGGFDADTFPLSLEFAVYDLARVLLADSPPVPGGANSISVGDVSVTFGTPTSGGVDALVPGLAARVAKWRNRWV